MPIRKPTRFGITQLEVLVCIGIVALLATLILPAINGTKSSNIRVKCSSNLRQIGQGLLLYANDNKGAYPRTHYAPDRPAIAFTGAAAPDPFASNGPAPNDVTAAFFLLVRTAGLPPEVFVCPDSRSTTDPLANLPATSRSNFSNPIHLSYSITHPYPDDASTKAGYKFDASAAADFAIIADLNPGTANRYNIYRSASPNAPAHDLAYMNSRNHEGKGQNVMFNDGHVEWFTTPFCGSNRDHIYTAQGATSGNPLTHQPAAPLDSVLVPTE